MKYELEKIESIIATGLFTSDGKPLYESKELTSGLQNTIMEEVERIKKTFIQEIFLFQNERHLERYIQFHQQELIRLINILSIEDSTIHAVEAARLKTHCHWAIENLLHFIEDHFTKYFDQDIKAPQHYVSAAAMDVLKSISDLKVQLASLKAEEQLVDLALAPLLKFIEISQSGKLTYRDVIYVNEIRKELYQVTYQHNPTRDLNEDLRQAILYLNFNTLPYFRYYTIHLNAFLHNADAGQDKLEKLSYALKLLNQSQVKPGVGYDRTLPSLKQQIGDWLVEEISYIERTQAQDRKQPVSSQLSQDYKIKIDLSVSALAYLLRVLFEIKLVQNKNMSDTMRFFVRSFQCKRLENISFESFRVRYYNTEEGTKKNVRNILLQMVDHINKN
ncbi:hypothetical protein [Chryseolinea lacunae]|uniref:Uncharacterized protein n=1 Tax=Chryseolinea lacunae TaxID=2801331 RepID=A0ABS1L2B8_9BACT|nr:hypothetical protein [Chryseolinea lacunae]MBL0745815.1 hypothetical protein [Chryseolinea lacunae]